MDNTIGLVNGEYMKILIKSKNKTSYERKIWKLLFLFCFAKMLPINNAVYIYGVTICCFIFIFNKYIVICRFKIKTSLLLVGFIMTIFQLLAILLYPIEYGNYDIFSILIFFISYLTLFVFISKVSVDEKDIIKLFKGLLIIICVFCFYNVINNIDIITHLYRYVGSAKRVQLSSFYGNKNTFAAFLFLSFCITWYLWIKLKKKIYTFALLLILANLILTFSRTSIACTFIFIFAFMLIYYKQKWVFVLVDTILLGGITAFLLIFRNVEFIDYFLIRSNTGTAGRDVLWEIGRQVFLKNPILGYGISTSSTILKNSGSSLSSFHNTYIETLISGGIIFFVMYCILIIYLFILYKNIFKYDRLLGATYISILYAHIIYSVFEGGLFFSVGGLQSVLTVILVTVPTLYHNSIKISNKVSIKRGV